MEKNANKFVVLLPHPNPPHFMERELCPSLRSGEGEGGEVTNLKKKLPVFFGQLIL